jgi:hypothetical protein
MQQHAASSVSSTAESKVLQIASNNGVGDEPESDEKDGSLPYETDADRRRWLVGQDTVADGEQETLDLNPAFGSAQASSSTKSSPWALSTNVAPPSETAKASKNKAQIKSHVVSEIQGRQKEAMGLDRAWKLGGSKYAPKEHSPAEVGLKSAPLVAAPRWEKPPESPIGGSEEWTCLICTL